jgi:hypothetical protein
VFMGFLYVLDMLVVLHRGVVVKYLDTYIYVDLPADVARLYFVHGQGWPDLVVRGGMEGGGCGMGWEGTGANSPGGGLWSSTGDGQSGARGREGWSGRAGGVSAFTREKHHISCGMAPVLCVTSHPESKLDTLDPSHHPPYPGCCRCRCLPRCRCSPGPFLKRTEPAATSQLMSMCWCC